MNEDAPETKSFEWLMQNMYRNHPIRVPILGTCESIREITPQMLYDCHRAFYTPGNMILCVVGDVDPDRIAEIAEEMLGTAPRPVGEKLRDWQEDMTVADAQTEAEMDIAMPMFQIGFKCEPTGYGEGAIRQEIVGDLAAEALFGESSELYLKLYEEGLIDSSFGGGFETIDGCAMLMCSGDSNDPERVWEAIVAQGAKLAESGIHEDVFLRMKRSALGRRIRGLDSFDSTCFRLCAYHLSRFDYFRFPEIYTQITREEVEAFLAEVVQAKRSAMSVIYPKQQEAV